MRVHFHEKLFGPSPDIEKNRVYHVSGIRFRKDSIHVLDESYREWLESLPAQPNGDPYYSILDDDGPVRKAAPNVAEEERTLREADDERTAVERHEAALARKHEGGDEVSRDTTPEPAKVKKGYGKSPAEKEAARRKKISETKKASGKKTPAQLRQEILGA